jgi:putative endonuclease
MSDWYLYMIKCRDDSLYTGITVDVERRFRDHVSQGSRCAKYLKGRAPLRLMFAVQIGDKRAAHQVERRVKQLRKSKKLALIRGELRVSDIFLSACP